MPNRPPRSMAALSMDKKIPIRFGARWIYFFLLLEGLTVPLVAAFNGIAIQNILYMSIMGFGVAFICVLCLMTLLRKLLLKHSLNLLGIQVDEIRGLWYISFLAGILLMIMFFVQDIVYQHGFGDFGAGFASAFASVSITLLFYELIVSVTGKAISLQRASQVFQLRFAPRDILIFTVLFSLYEYIVCPLTSLWVPLHEHRVLVALGSGFLGGGCGGVLLYLLTRFTPFFNANLTLRSVTLRR